MTASLQVYQNLDILVEKIQETLGVIIKDITVLFHNQLDLDEISREVKKEHAAKPPTGSVRRVNEPNASDKNSAEWAAILWKRMEGLIDGMYKKCIMIYTLERGLEKMKDSASNKSFLEIVNKVHMIMLKYRNLLGIYKLYFGKACPQILKKNCE
jgi:hypothetical protein